jgi:hypothetical protein
VSTAEVVKAFAWIQKLRKRALKKKGGNTMKKITKAEIDKWAKEQRRRYHAGLLEPWQIKALKKEGFDFGPAPKFGETAVGTIICENKLNSEKKYEAFRRKHPKLRPPTSSDVRVAHTLVYGAVSRGGNNGTR